MKSVQCILFLFCINVIQGRIRVDVSSDENSQVKVTYSGIDTKVVSNEEITSFKLDQRNLLNALKQHYGRKPNNVYLKSPTPWEDLYQKYKWEQVTRTLTVKSANVRNVERKPVVVMTENFENFSNKTIKVNTGISQTVENSVTTSWSKDQEFTIGQEIEYDVNVVFAKLSGTTSISFTTSWGKSVEKSETVSIGSSTSIETELAPGQGATAVLSANRGYIELEIVYAARLRGNLAVNFRRPYKGHHFLGPHVETVMEAGGLKNELTTVETIRVGVYMDASLKVYDKVTGLPL